jgi:GNAT superfamily N-acetyltransferase
MSPEMVLDNAMTVVLLPVLTELPVGFDALRTDAHREGHTNMERLATDWVSGPNRFAATGEALLAAFVAGELAGVGGLTRDPTCPDALRLRRFYVPPAWRRLGVGRCLALTLMDRARQQTDRVVLNAETELAVRFWEALGFVRDCRDGHSHIWR